MKETLTMSYRETDRLKVISRIEHHELTVVEAAESLQLSERQVYRILRRYHSQGDQGILHRLRGRSSNAAFSINTRNQALQLYRERYSDYGPTLFTEKLETYHDIHVSRQVATRWLAEASLWSGSRKKRPHRKKRERRNTMGSLVQFDGSEHDWFEGRHSQCCLLVSVDDASSRIFARFALAEDTENVLLFWHQYIERFGIPSEIYTDFGSVYHDNRGNQHLTQYGRAMTALGITLIYAHSPQAKGRVERNNRTLQDRLIKALREQNISSIQKANLFLDSSFLEDYNRRFSQKEPLTDIHRSSRGIDLQNIFCYQYIRHVYNDWTITLGAAPIQLLKSAAPLPPPRAKVFVHQWLNGSIHIFWNDNELAFTILKNKPKSTTKKVWRPHENHPWRHKLAGRKHLQNKNIATHNKFPYDTTFMSVKPVH
jgi:hypothetical protein